MPRVKLTGGVWTDLYAASSIAVGTQLSVQNVSSPTVTIQTSATEPTVMAGNIIPATEVARNKAGSVGEWAYSSVDAELQVDEA